MNYDTECEAAGPWDGQSANLVSHSLGLLSWHHVSQKMLVKIRTLSYEDRFPSEDFQKHEACKLAQGGLAHSQSHWFKEQSLSRIPLGLRRTQDVTSFSQETVSCPDRKMKSEML